MDYPSLGFYVVEGFMVGIVQMLDEVGKNQGDWSRDTRQAVDHDVGPLQAIIDVVRCLVKIFTDVERFMVVSRHVEKVRDVGLWVPELNSLGSSENRLDLMS